MLKILTPADGSVGMEHTARHGVAWAGFSLHQLCQLDENAVWAAAVENCTVCYSPCRKST